MSANASRILILIATVGAIPGCKRVDTARVPRADAGTPAPTDTDLAERAFELSSDDLLVSRVLWGERVGPTWDDVWTVWCSEERGYFAMRHTAGKLQVTPIEMGPHGGVEPVEGAHWWCHQGQVRATADGALLAWDARGSSGVAQIDRDGRVRAQRTLRTRDSKEHPSAGAPEWRIVGLALMSGAPLALTGLVPGAGSVGALIDEELVVPYSSLSVLASEKTLRFPRVPGLASGDLVSTRLFHYRGKPRVLLWSDGQGARLFVFTLDLEDSRISLLASFDGGTKLFAAVTETSGDAVIGWLFQDAHVPHAQARLVRLSDPGSVHQLPLDLHEDADHYSADAQPGTLELIRAGSAWLLLWGRQAGDGAGFKIDDEGPTWSMVGGDFPLTRRHHVVQVGSALRIFASTGERWTSGYWLQRGHFGNLITEPSSLATVIGGDGLDTLIEARAVGDRSVLYIRPSYVVPDR